MFYLPRTKIDYDPPKELVARVEEFIKNSKPKRQDFIPEKFIGKGPGGYLLRNWIYHRGKSAAKVSRNFKQAVQFMGTDKQYKLSTQ
mmetsp:Transcript_34643/g.25791  ORF Transcript_34643/g.25791 Transcript_34643/m.25791 type:complete len:87 (+) Transcript_34643:667-927(+)